MDNEKENNKKLTRTDWLLIAVLIISVLDFITRIIKG